MKFYTQQHRHYCGIDLHARKMYVCIIDQKGKVRVHENIQTDSEQFFELIFPFIEDVVVGVECVFCPAFQAGSSTGNGLPISAPHIKFRLFSAMHYT